MFSSQQIKSYYPSGTPLFQVQSPVFEERIHPASLDVCGSHNPALLEFIRTDPSMELISETHTSCLPEIPLILPRLHRRTHNISYRMQYHLTLTTITTTYTRQKWFSGRQRAWPTLSRNLHRRCLRTIERPSVHSTRHGRLP